MAWGIWAVVTAAVIVTYSWSIQLRPTWNEQIVKRGWTDEGIPSALLPGVKPIWGVIIGLAILATVVLLREDKHSSYSAP